MNEFNVCNINWIKSFFLADNIENVIKKWASSRVTLAIRNVIPSTGSLPVSVFAPDVNLLAVVRKFVIGSASCYTSAVKSNQSDQPKISFRRNTQRKCTNAITKIDSTGKLYFDINELIFITVLGARQRVPSLILNIMEIKLNNKEIPFHGAFDSRVSWYLRFIHTPCFNNENVNSLVQFIKFR